MSTTTSQTEAATQRVTRDYSVRNVGGYTEMFVQPQRTKQLGFPNPALIFGLVAYKAVASMLSDQLTEKVSLTTVNNRSRSKVAVGSGEMEPRTSSRLPCGRCTRTGIHCRRNTRRHLQLSIFDTKRVLGVKFMPQNAIVGEGEAACMCRQRSSHRRDQLPEVEAHAVLSQRAEQTIAVVQARVDLPWDDGLNNDEMMYLMGLKAGSAAVAVGVAAMIIAPC
ncbi:uncharacterized protein K489DRAFT_384338 [Dissoconium aciculare CBS 342.82]|uniref:Uncharacterized protein n=1 Tax=Dissoconium aciculare CBS 342.82 TaxID=1314786 RepID=A0A6J3LSS1_9PEZI|nr:uncharacterized protein K489DRAFT_384338 [Dissoconium aciculare CBS 342.82]KAF1818845.1 hypothetical protein K489DRAFT_384338 [Dissoconium aciculare CBS 342.82]